MKIHFIGHVALLISFNNSKILIDPVLNSIGPLLLVNNISNNKNESEVGDMLNNLDAVLYTSSFVENIESKSIKAFANKIPILCHPKDEIFFNNQGFRCVTSISDEYEIKSLKISKPIITGKKIFSLKESSYGFLLKSAGEPSIYLTGASPYDNKLKKIILEENPDIVIFNNLSKNKSKIDKLTNTFIKNLEKDDIDFLSFTMNIESGSHVLISKNDININQKENICAVSF
jgi:L-ascorbate metabolism protein UlaG (beta-lactamase superfamily)